MVEQRIKHMLFVDSYCLAGQQVYHEPAIHPLETKVANSTLACIRDSTASRLREVTPPLFW